MTPSRMGMKNVDRFDRGHNEMPVVIKLESALACQKEKDQREQKPLDPVGKKTQASGLWL